MNIAIILSGCGNRDGSELQETLSLMLAIDRRGWKYQCFAPEGGFDAVNYLTGGDENCQRDILVESARVARGDIKPLDEYRVADYDALALPGGMGAARNLSDYAYEASRMEVRVDVEEAILATYRSKKPVLAMCIAPMVLAKVLGPYGVSLTLGGENTAARVAEELGAHCQVCGPTEVCRDAEHRVYTTPAYMVATRISEIFDGAENMIAALEADFKC